MDLSFFSTIFSCAHVCTKCVPYIDRETPGGRVQLVCLMSRARVQPVYRLIRDTHAQTHSDNASESITATPSERPKLVLVFVFLLQTGGNSRGRRFPSPGYGSSWHLYRWFCVHVSLDRQSVFQRACVRLCILFSYTYTLTIRTRCSVFASLTDIEVKNMPHCSQQVVRGVCVMCM